LSAKYQKRKRFSHDIQRSAGLAEFHLSLRQPLPQPLILRTHARVALMHDLGNGSGLRFQRTGIPRLAPVADMRVIKALAAQQRAFRARFGRRVVFLDHRHFVRGGEGAPFRLGRPRAVRSGCPAPGWGVLHV
jgi:hypothetical protein